MKKLKWAQINALGAKTSMEQIRAQITNLIEHGLTNYLIRMH